MIKSFACKLTKELFETGLSRVFSSIAKVALRKLDMLNSAYTTNDLKIPPADRLEPLLGDREGQHSIRVNDKYRVCFKWQDNNAEKAEITDYHK